MEQMKIEILTPQNMVNKGSSFIRVLMNEHTPILDLFVRESIQNCLDAASDDNRRGYVTVKYNVGKFRSSNLNEILEGISEGLNKRYKPGDYTFISISDMGTSGLTGPMKIEDVKDGMSQGNLLKLVYDVGKPQENETAGGSWGYGKTIYSRIGIGLVFYYSRIINEKGKYESRLAACLAEDETKRNALIPKYKGLAKYGIAWWGELIKENKTIPITDEKYIKKFLSIFGLSVYEGNEVGTRIIIPYVDEDYLLDNNAKDYSESIDDKNFVPYWRNSIEDYLRVAIQRWYFPRLNNRAYGYGKWLDAYVNDERISEKNMLHIFRLYQSMYNWATHEEVPDDDYILVNHIEPYEDDIKINGITEKYAGRVVCVEVEGDSIGLCPPHNEDYPNISMGLDINDITKNYPVIAYTRKPGMIVSYEQSGDWLKDVPCSNSDKYILALFALNSDAYLTKVDDLSLEQYVRKGEMADHISWNDTSYYGVNLNTIYRIKHNTAKILSQYFEEEAEEDDDTSRISGLGRMLGKMILPPVGFGIKPTSKGSKTRGSKGSAKIKSVKFELVDIKYGKNFMLIQYEILASRSAKQFEMDIDITSKSSPITMQAWEEEMAIEKPFEISESILKITKKDGRKSYNSYRLVAGKTYKDELLIANIISTSHQTPYGIGVEFVSQHDYEMELTIKLDLYKKDICPKINFK